MEPASPEKILAAFQILDPEQKTYITKEYMSKMMMEEGEPFTQEELDEMLAVAIDPITGNIPYEFYINQLMVSSICFCSQFALNFALNALCICICICTRCTTQARTSEFDLWACCKILDFKTERGETRLQMGWQSN